VAFVTTALVITVTKVHGYAALALVPEAVAASAWCMRWARAGTGDRCRSHRERRGRKYYFNL
jgi:hypothetical protein